MSRRSTGLGAQGPPAAAAFWFALRHRLLNLHLRDTTSTPRNDPILLHPPQSSRHLRHEQAAGQVPREQQSCCSQRVWGWIWLLLFLWILRFPAVLRVRAARPLVHLRCQHRRLIQELVQEGQHNQGKGAGRLADSHHFTQRSGRRRFGGMGAFLRCCLYVR